MDYKTHDITKLYKECFEQGHLDEELVKRVLPQVYGGIVYKALLHEDMIQHVDLWWESPKGGKIGIDVKGRKKQKRNDSNYSNIHWIEGQNVCGNKGWIYGKSKYIAFITDKDILFVQSNKLVAIYENIVKNKTLVYENPRECLVPYQRKASDRKDIVFKIENKNLEEIASFKIQLTN